MPLYWSALQMCRPLTAVGQLGGGPGDFDRRVPYVLSGARDACKMSVA